MPTIRATTTSALASPCTSSSVLASSAALTGARASPNPKPPSTQRDVRREALAGVSSSQRGHQHERRRRRSAMPTAVTTPAGRRAGEVAADHRADRQRDQEPDQHQRGHQLGVAVDRGAGEERDVDQRRDQGGADEEADQQRAPGRRAPQRAARDQRRLGAAQVEHEGDGGDGGAEEVPEALVGEDLDLRVGGGEGEDHAGQRDARGTARRPGRPRGRCAAQPRQVDQRAARRSRSGRRTARRRRSRPRRAGSASGRRRRTG